MNQEPSRGEQDALLCGKAQTGDIAAANRLIQAYLPLVRHFVGRCRSDALEPEDLLQEGLIGLFNAVLAYDAARGAAFSTFAYHCVQNRLRNALTQASGAAVYPGQEMPAAAGDPQEILQSHENLRAWEQRAQEILSAREKQVLRLYLSDCSYREIADRLNTTEKSVDNTMQRVRRKMRADPNR